MITEPDNLRRAQPGTYEVWYLTWNHPGDDAGYWLRHVIEPGYAELWFARFDAKDPTRSFGVHQRFATATATDAPFSVAIGGATLAHDRAAGALAAGGHDVAWDLRWDPAPCTLRLLPDVMYARGGLGETTVHSPNPRVAMSGTVRVDGQTFQLDRVVMGQTHLWGKKHAYSWTWGRCAEFAGSDALIELLGVRLERRGFRLPPLVLVTLAEGGEMHRLGQFRHVVLNRATWDVGKVTFSARNTRVKIEGELTCTPAQMLNAPYLDPDGTEVFCANTEIGDAHVTVWKRGTLGWREHVRLEGRRRAHFEVGGRTKDPRVVRDHLLIE
jgi:hypothetical protein